MMYPKNPHLLVDADIILYRCGFAAEKTFYLVETGGNKDQSDRQIFDNHKEAKNYSEESKGTIWSRKEIQPLSFALENVKNVLTKLKQKYEPRTVSLFLTGKGNFRDTIAKTKEYKDNRDPGHRPKHYRAIKEYLVKTHGATVVNGMEADDAIGIESDAHFIRNDPFVIISNDKDLDQLQGWHYDWTKDIEWYVDYDTSRRVLYTQLLCGDATDNIPGILSERKAFEAINSCKDEQDMKIKVLEAYKERYGDDWEKNLREINSLIRIRTRPLGVA
jgi:5'-3' exonuclease